ncbi:hypothetical protein EAG_03715 [Camponotus floridanus]|uniref:Uncharacterized protein n=1 Tax=Camponotus floridanus TaxID=104421 RepID=E2AMR0_CAMFO|nr:hypothetical protein EAG_03715 [Camponotus floridanus]
MRNLNEDQNGDPNGNQNADLDENQNGDQDLVTDTETENTQHDNGRHSVNQADWTLECLALQREHPSSDTVRTPKMENVRHRYGKLIIW